MPGMQPQTGILEGLAALAERGRESLCPADHSRIAISAAACGRAAGATVFGDQLRARSDLDGVARIVEVGCVGACFAEPIVDVRRPSGVHYVFGRADQSYWHIFRTATRPEPSGAPWLVARERTRGVLASVDDLEIVEARQSALAEFVSAQTRRVSARCGLIDPMSITEYAAAGGYQALARVVGQCSPADVVEQIAQAGLRGRGGAGYPTGPKWRVAAASSDPVRFVVANADEGDPGAYMNRALLESDPHSVLEGLIIASYATDAHQAYLFVRHEYPLAVQTLRHAVASAYAEDILGSSVLGSGYALDVDVIESAGAFVCGEETAMLQAISGRRGEPQRRPPYPAEAGLGGHPTVINNVETLANVPWIILHSAQAFRSCGTAKSSGTKIFCLTGDVSQTGFAEVPFGTAPAELLKTMGHTRIERVRALQVGGPLGGIVPPSEVELAYESVGVSGAAMGSGGLVALGKERCVVSLASHLVGFSAAESCGRCVVCRDGLVQLHAMLEALTCGQAYAHILDDIQDLALTIQALSQCGLGRGAVNPVLSTLRHFRAEYEEHVGSRCPALVCKGLITFEIDSQRCPPSCQHCFLVCPAQAIKQDERGRYFVDQSECTNCWACHEVCPRDCVRPVPKDGGAV